MKHGLYKTPLYRIWGAMRSRCMCPTDPVFKYYGGRGIQVCKRWDSFEKFLSDMGPRPSADYELDRRNNDGDYEPRNCRWATHAEQMRNRRTNRRLTFDGRTLPIIEWAERLGLKPVTISSRLSRGKTIEQALSPAQRRSR